MPVVMPMMIGGWVLLPAGVLALDEIELLLERLHIVNRRDKQFRAMARQIIQEYDTNQNGSLDFDEFLRCWEHLSGRSLCVGGHRDGGHRDGKDWSEAVDEEDMRVLLVEQEGVSEETAAMLMYARPTQPVVRRAGRVRTGGSEPVERNTSPVPSGGGGGRDR